MIQSVPIIPYILELDGLEGQKVSQSVYNKSVFYNENIVFQVSYYETLETEQSMKKSASQFWKRSPEQERAAITRTIKLYILSFFHII